MTLRTILAIALAVSLVSTASAQAPMSYGPSINAETAKRVAAPAIAEARKNNLAMAIAIVDPAGDLVYFEKMDDTQVASTTIAIDKARSAARLKRETKTLQDALAAGGAGLRILALNGAVPVDGGVPLIVGGKIVGAIGASGGTSEQDGMVARAGAATLK
jgi:glc operon protein GlcG